MLLAAATTGSKMKLPKDLVACFMGQGRFTYRYVQSSVILPVQAATGGRSGVSVYKAGRSVPLDSAQLDLSRLALPQLGSAGVENVSKSTYPPQV